MSEEHYDTYWQGVGEETELTSHFYLQDINALTDEVTRLKLENEELKRQLDILIANSGAEV